MSNIACCLIFEAVNAVLHVAYARQPLVQAVICYCAQLLDIFLVEVG